MTFYFLGVLNVINEMIFICINKVSWIKLIARLKTLFFKGVFLFNYLCKYMGRLLAIDFGTKRTGIAVTDPMQIIASGLTTVNTVDLIIFLKGYVSQENVDKFIIGLPKQMDNTASESEVYIQKFLKKLNTQIPDIPVVRVDERFTSKMAFQTMIDCGLSKKQRKNKALVDEISATLILQSYMASN